MFRFWAVGLFPAVLAGMWWGGDRSTLAAGSTQTTAVEAVRPNIVLIVADDLGWTGLGCFGSDFYETPHIDRLAGEGMKFDYGYAAMHICAPSRASLMSGQFVGRHRVLYVGNYQQRWKQRNGNLHRFKLLQPPGEKSLPNSTSTIAESLKKRGYATAMFGKWHLGVKSQHPSQRGFDVAIVSHGKHFGFTTTPPAEHPSGQYLSDFLADRAVHFIRRCHKEQRPFFLYFPDFLVHKPLEAKEAYLDHFEKKRPGKHQRSPVAGAMIKSLDDTVGRIVGTLDELGLSQNTLVVFTSDNGGLAYAEDGDRTENSSNLPLRGRKGSEFDGGLRVPFIFRWPGTIPQGTTCHEVICGVDLYPTLLTLAGAPRPSHELDGVDLVPLLRDPQATLPQRDICWHMPSYSSFHRPCIVVRRGDWKLIHLFETGENELYNTADDIGETKNVASRRPDVVRELSESLERWMKEVDAPRMKPNPSFNRSDKLRRRARRK